MERLLRNQYILHSNRLILFPSAAFLRQSTLYLHFKISIIEWHWLLCRAVFAVAGRNAISGFSGCRRDIVAYTAEKGALPEAARARGAELCNWPETEAPTVFQSKREVGVKI